MQIRLPRVPSRDISSMQSAWIFFSLNVLGCSGYKFNKIETTAQTRIPLISWSMKTINLKFYKNFDALLEKIRSLPIVRTSLTTQDSFQRKMIVKVTRTSISRIKARTYSASYLQKQRSSQHWDEKRIPRRIVDASWSHAGGALCSSHLPVTRPFQPSKEQRIGPWSLPYHTVWCQW